MEIMFWQPNSVYPQMKLYFKLCQNYMHHTQSNKKKCNENQRRNKKRIIHILIVTNRLKSHKIF